MFPRALDRLGRVLGRLPFAVMLKIIGSAMKGSLPAERDDALVAEMQKNDARFVGDHTHRYLEYLDRHGSLVERLCDSGVRAWVGFGLPGQPSGKEGVKFFIKGMREAFPDIRAKTIEPTLADGNLEAAHVVLDRHSQGGVHGRGGDRQNCRNRIDRHLSRRGRKGC